MTWKRNTGNGLLLGHTLGLSSPILPALSGSYFPGFHARSFPGPAREIRMGGWLYLVPSSWETKALLLSYSLVPRNKCKKGCPYCSHVSSYFELPRSFHSKLREICEISSSKTCWNPTPLPCWPHGIASMEKARLYLPCHQGASSHDDDGGKRRGVNPDSNPTF